MPRRSIPDAKYPDDWKAIAERVKDEAGWCCIRCGVAHDPPAHVLTVHHLDMNPSNNLWFNLAALCSRCHLSIQSRVVMDRVWVMLPHSEWFKPLVAGHYARKYLGETLTRDEVMSRIDELLELERQVVGVGA